MYIGLHQFAERSVNAPVSRKQGLSRERGANDAHAEVATSVACAGMPGVLVALVFDYEFDRGKLALQARANALDPFAQGSTLRNGCTLTLR